MSGDLESGLGSGGFTGTLLGHATGSVGERLGSTRNTVTQTASGGASGDLRDAVATCCKVQTMAEVFWIWRCLHQLS